MPHFAVIDTNLLYVKRRGGEDFTDSPGFDPLTETVHTMIAGQKKVVGRKLQEHTVEDGEFVLLAGAELQAVIDAGVFAEFRNDAIEIATINTGMVHIDFELKTSWCLELTENVTAFTYTTAPGVFQQCTLKLKQDNNGARSFTWPSSMDWANGDEPVISAMEGAQWVWITIVSDGTNVSWSFSPFFN